MKNPIQLVLIATRGEVAARGLLRRALRGLRFPARGVSEVEQTAALNRAQRIFEVNFRSTSWTR